jgi:hypothetical protein
MALVCALAVQTVEARGLGRVLRGLAELVLTIKFPVWKLGLDSTREFANRGQFYEAADSWLATERTQVEERQQRLVQAREAGLIDDVTFKWRNDQLEGMKKNQVTAHQLMKSARRDAHGRFLTQAVARLGPRLASGRTFKRILGDVNGRLDQLSRLLQGSACRLDRLAASALPTALGDLQTSIRRVIQKGEESGLFEFVPGLRGELARLDRRLTRAHSQISDPRGMRRELVNIRDKVAAFQNRINTKADELASGQMVVAPTPGRRVSKGAKAAMLVSGIREAEGRLDATSAINEAIMRGHLGPQIDEELRAWEIDPGSQDGLRIREGVLDRMLVLPKGQPPNEEDLQRIWQDVTRDVTGHPLTDEVDQQSDADVDAEFGKLLEACDDEEPAAARPAAATGGTGVTRGSPTTTDAKALQEAMWKQCLAIHDNCVKKNCGTSGYSGCVPDCGNCASLAPATAYNPFWLGLESGYKGCADGAAGPYVSKVGSCVSNFLADTKAGRQLVEGQCLRQAWTTFAEQIDACQEASCRTYCGMQGQTMTTFKPACECKAGF